MSSVQLLLPAAQWGVPWGGRAPVQPPFRLTGDGGLVVVLPFAPMPTELSGLAGTWTQLPRPGRLPLLLRSAHTLPELKFTLMVADPLVDVSVEPLLSVLKAAAVSGQRFTVCYGPQENGLWHITALSINAVARQPVTNLITQATAAMTLTAVSDVTNVGPLSGGVRVAPPGVPAAPPGTPPGPAGRTYTVVAGDTLWAISLRFYSNPLFWGRIADANHIVAPRLLQIGTVLTIP